MMSVNSQKEKKGKKAKRQKGKKAKSQQAFSKILSPRRNFFFAHFR
jgi:hypothetical protein